MSQLRKSGEKFPTHVHVLTITQCPCSRCCAVTLTSVAEAVIVVVVLEVVLQRRRAAGSQFCQFAAGCGELRSEVGHFLTRRLDGPIDPLCQLLVVFHHFKDFPLRSKSTQSSMVSAWVWQGVKLTPFSRSPSTCTSFLMFSLHIKNKKRQKAPSCDPGWAARRWSLIYYCIKEQRLQWVREHVCEEGKVGWQAQSAGAEDRGAEEMQPSRRRESDRSRRAECAVSSCSLWGPCTHWDDMQPFKWTVPCGGRDGGGRAVWTDVLSSNSPTAPYAANPTPCGACNEKAAESVVEEKVLIVSLYFFCLRAATLRAWQRCWTSTCQALCICSHVLLRSPLTHTAACLFVSPTPPFSFYYTSISLSWESSPPHRWEGKGAGTRHPRGKHFNTQKT